MFADTHCHITYLAARGIDTASVIRELALKHTPFVLDSGTEADDLQQRMQFVDTIIALFDDGDVRKEAASMFRFAAGIWPDKKAVQDRKVRFETLKEHIEEFSDARLCAVGECGLDHYWEPDTIDYAGEAELFEMQLMLAQKLHLPVIVHSRDAFEQTLGCIKNTGTHRGLIHCCTYGKEEVRAFLDEGLYISFAGSVTYAKKKTVKENEALLRFVPADRLLLETDAPYLAPVPLRGKPNTPLLIEHTYRFVARIRGVGTEQLAAEILKNARELFLVKCPGPCR